MTETDDYIVPEMTFHCTGILYPWYSRICADKGR